MKFKKYIYIYIIMVNWKSKYLEMKLKYINAKNKFKGGMQLKESAHPRLKSYYKLPDRIRELISDDIMNKNARDKYPDKKEEILYNIQNRIISMYDGEFMPFNFLDKYGFESRDDIREDNRETHFIKSIMNYHNIQWNELDLQNSTKEEIEKNIEDNKNYINKRLDEIDDNEELYE